MVGEKLFQTNLLSRLSHKVCRLLSSPVLLRKFTNVFRTKVLIGETTFTSSTGDGTAILRGHLSHARL